MVVTYSLSCRYKSSSRIIVRAGNKHIQMKRQMNKAKIKTKTRKPSIKQMFGKEQWQELVFKWHVQVSHYCTEEPLILLFNRLLWTGFMRLDWSRWTTGCETPLFVQAFRRWSFERNAKFQPMEPDEMWPISVVWTLFRLVHCEPSAVVSQYLVDLHLVGSYSSHWLTQAWNLHNEGWSFQWCRVALCKF